MVELKRQIRHANTFQIRSTNCAKLYHVIMDIYMNMDGPFEYVEKNYPWGTSILKITLNFYISLDILD